MQWNFRVTNYWLVHDYFDISCSPLLHPEFHTFPLSNATFGQICIPFMYMYFHGKGILVKRHTPKTSHS